MKFRIVLVALLMVLVLMVSTACSNGDTNGGLSGQKEQISEFTNFTTKDIYDQEVTEEVFKDYDLTMVNVWGTFCGPCIDEMPYLGEIQKEYQDKGVNVVGFLVDAQDENLDIDDAKIELAKEIQMATGADYPHMLISEDLVYGILGEISSIPTSFFIDSDGNFVGKTYIGARDKEGWVDIIEKTKAEISK